MSELVNQEMFNDAYNLCKRNGYSIIEKIANGGFGVVYRVIRDSDQLKCAAKVCPYIHPITQAVIKIYRYLHLYLIYCYFSQLQESSTFKKSAPMKTLLLFTIYL